MVEVASTEIPPVAATSSQIVLAALSLYGYIRRSNGHNALVDIDTYCNSE